MVSETNDETTQHIQGEECEKATYICPTEPATSVHRVSISSFSVCSAKTLSSGSVSERNPRTPEAEVKPGMIEEVRLFTV